MSSDGNYSSSLGCAEAPALKDDEASPFSVEPAVHTSPRRENSTATADFLLSGAVQSEGAFTAPLCARFHDGSPGPARQVPDSTGYASVSPLSCSALVGGYFRRRQRFIPSQQTLRMLQRTGTDGGEGGATGATDRSESTEWLNVSDFLVRMAGTAAASGAGTNVTLAVESAQSLGVSPLLAELLFKTCFFRADGPLGLMSLPLYCSSDVKFESISLWADVLGLGLRHSRVVSHNSLNDAFNLRVL
jgi:hypothetical protein